MMDIETDMAAVNADAVMKAIRRIAHAIDTRSKQIGRESGLTIPQIVVLKAVSVQGALTTAAISRQADLSAATTVTILDKLEAKGLIRRNRSTSDRRTVQAELTETGRAALLSSPSFFADGFASDFASFSKTEQQDIVAAFTMVADLLDRHDVEKT